MIDVKTGMQTFRGEGVRPFIKNQTRSYKKKAVGPGCGKKRGAQS